MSTTAMADAPARARIETDLDSTLVVEAAAGTGKTTALIGRMLAIIETGRGQLERMVALTFTDKAAGEMKLRLRTELERARQLDEAHGDRERIARLDDALRVLEEAHIGTIHAFCGDLLHQRPIEAGVDPRFEVGGEDEADLLFDRVFDGFIQRALEAPPPGVRRALRRSAPGQSALSALRAAARTLREQRDFPAPWARPELDREAGIDRALAQLTSLSAVAKLAGSPRDPLARDLLGIADFVKERSATEAVRGARDYDELEYALRGLLRQRLWARKGQGKWFSQGLLRDEVVATREGVRVELERLLRALEADLSAQLHEDLRPLIVAYEEEKARAGTLDYLDLLIKARDLLRDNADVRRELQQRFSHVFVDEFQDTDPLQAEIIRLLCLVPGQEQQLVPGKLFVVGDPKQAIYRFRRADVTLYERIKRELVAQGGQVLYLTTSFRSLPAIQSLVNVAFATHMRPAEDGSQAAYRPLSPYRGDYADQPAVLALPVPRPYGPWGRVTNKAIEESLPDAVAALIEHLVDHSGYQVQDGAQRVPLRPRHICLLFRRFRSYGAESTRPYVRALESRRIPHVLLGGRSFHAREEVLALTVMLRAIEWPDDALHVYAALRGPLFSLGDDALLDYREHVGPLHPLARRQPALSGSRADVAEALGLLERWHLQRNRRPTAETIGSVLEATRAHAGIAIWPTGEQALANVMRVADQARRFERRGSTSFRAFVEWLDDGDEREGAREAPVIEDGTEGVRMMTVHAAKGLEFPVVVLCDPTVPRTAQHPSRHVDASLGLWATSLCQCAPLELEQHREAILRQDEAEEIRIAYVAATRAKDMLVVPAVGDEPRAGWVDVLHRGLYPAFSERRSPLPAAYCPAFGRDSVLEAPAQSQRIPDESVQPGLHTPMAGEHRVVWWDPAALALDREPVFGLRQQELLMEDEGGEQARAGLAMHAEWMARRTAALSKGGMPSVTARPVTSVVQELADPPPSHAPRSERVADRDPDRPRGKRFGSLVHAIIADARFDDAPAWLEQLSRLHGRVLGASDAEVQHAVTAARAALAHPLLQQAKASADTRFECPIALRAEDGSVVEGNVDLAFLHRQPRKHWVVVDFKTDLEPQDKPEYLAQVALYARAIEAATGLPAEAILLAV